MALKNNAPARVPDCHPERKHCAKGMCKPCYDNNYQKRNRGRASRKAQEWAKAHPAKVKAARQKYRYGVTPDVVEARLNAQGGLCKICGSAPAEHIDHNHTTGEVRCLLCGPCNRGVGMFREDPERLLSAIRYLGLWGDTQAQGIYDRAVQVIPNTGLRADGKDKETIDLSTPSKRAEAMEEYGEYMVLVCDGDKWDLVAKAR